MDIIRKYKGILRGINAEIERFNSQLARFRFDLLDASDDGPRLIVAGRPWKELDLGKCPHGDCPGLYVLCAYQKDDPTCLAAYIGKASIGTMTISSRVDSNLRKAPEREKGIYTMNDLEGQTFIIEAVVAIGVPSDVPREMRAFASALEEFVIAKVQAQDGIHLLNGTGVER